MEQAIQVKVIQTQEAARRREMARLRQRRRRERWVRIDFYPDQDTYEVIESLKDEHAPLNSYSAVINHIIREHARSTKSRRSNR